MYKRFVFAAVLLTIISLCFTSVSAASLILKSGMQRNEVSTLQSNMRKLGYFNINPTGYYGSITTAAVKKLQKKHGLVIDGIAGNATFSLINKLLGQTVKPTYKASSIVTGISRGEVNRKFTVVIDPGHGGMDTGAIYENVFEKDLNLAIAKKLSTLLKALNINIYMTRADDSYVSLSDRSKLANSLNSDLFISVHNNAGDRAIAGSMSLYYPSVSHSNGNLSAYDFASIVQKELWGTLGTKNLGLIPRPYLSVLRRTNMPAVIAEVGYMSNPVELDRLCSNTFQKNAAEALKKAVLAALANI